MAQPVRRKPKPILTTKNGTPKRGDKVVVRPTRAPAQ